MYGAQAVIRDFNPTSDTCSVELVGIGVIDTWLDGISIEVGINRHFLAAGVSCTVIMPDPNRLCEATITALDLSPAVATTQYNPPPAGSLRIQSIRVPVTTNGAGAGSVAVTWPTPFSVSPTVSAYADSGSPLSISAVTATGCTISVSGAGANTTVYISATATGG